MYNRVFRKKIKENFYYVIVILFACNKYYILFITICKFYGMLFAMNFRRFLIIINYINENSLRYYLNLLANVIIVFLSICYSLYNVWLNRFLYFRFFALILDCCLIAATALLIYSYADGDFFPRSVKIFVAINRSDISW